MGGSAIDNGLRPHRAARVVNIDDEVTPGLLASLDPLSLRHDGRRIVRLQRPITLGRDAALDLHLIRFLRESVSVALRIEWMAHGDPRWTATDVRHLPPPTSGMDEWREQFKIGSCHYRVGPGFILIRDTRIGTGARYLLDDADCLAGLQVLTEVVRVDRLSPGQRTAHDVLAAEDLVATADGLVTLLPARMRRWPVPETAV